MRKGPGRLFQGLRTGSSRGRTLIHTRWGRGGQVKDSPGAWTRPQSSGGLTLLVSRDELVPARDARNRGRVLACLNSLGRL
jgi:hypothetical protein